MLILLFLNDSATPRPNLNLHLNNVIYPQIIIYVDKGRPQAHLFSTRSLSLLKASFRIMDRRATDHGHRFMKTLPLLQEASNQLRHYLKAIETLPQSTNFWKRLKSLVYKNVHSRKSAYTCAS